MNNKIQAKDLINIGIFSALYFIVVMAAAMLGYIPIFIPLLAVFCPLVGGIPFMLFLTRVRKFGMLTIMGTIFGILMLIFGMGWFSIFTGILFGFLADMVQKSGHYASARKSILCSGVFSMWLIGNFVPIVVTRDSYYQGLLSGYGQEYADTLMSYMPNWILIVLLAACLIFGILGGLLGKSLLKKHFVRAGIA